MFSRLRLAAMAVLLLAPGMTQARTPRMEPEERLAAVERAAGGRLGVALIDARGRTILARRADERFAMCSTFKLLLAGQILQRGTGLNAPLGYTQRDILPNSPVSESHLAVQAERPMTVTRAMQAIIERSDNTAANLLLRQVGGPAGLTAWLRAQGDRVTRLDRPELALNQNARGDPRDTTSPAAMAGSARRLLVADGLSESQRRQLREWTVASRTGIRRIRAGLPAGWEAGDKTGTCRDAVNDVAFFRTPSGNEYILAVYHDRPASIERGERAIAEVARVIARLVH